MPSAIANRSIVSMRTDRSPRSMRLMCVRCKRAAWARASCVKPRLCLASLTRRPNVMAYLLPATLDNGRALQTIQQPTKRNLHGAASGRLPAGRRL